MKNRDALRQVNRAGSKELEPISRTKDRYDVFECDHCGKAFTKRSRAADYGLAREVRGHLEREHEDLLERPEYDNEPAFRGWAEAIGERVEEPRTLAWERGVPLLVRLGEMRLVELHPDGAVTLTAERHVGGERDTDRVAAEGERLAVYRGGEKSYVSPSAFPVLDP